MRTTHLTHAITALLLLTGRLYAQDVDRVPWATDVKATREGASKERKPCVVIVGIDGKGLWGLIKDVEASLLSSNEMKELCQKVPVVALRNGDKVEELRKEFSIPFVAGWVVVLDAKQEILGTFRSDTTGAGCNKDTVDKFPAMLVSKIEDSLKCTESLQELERRWTKDKTEKDFDKLMQRLAEGWQYRRASELLETRTSGYKSPDQVPETLIMKSIEYQNKQREVEVIRTIQSEKQGQKKP